MYYKKFFLFAKSTYPSCSYNSSSCETKNYRPRPLRHQINKILTPNPKVRPSDVPFQIQRLLVDNMRHTRTVRPAVPENVPPEHRRRLRHHRKPFRNPTHLQALRGNTGRRQNRRFQSNGSFDREASGATDFADRRRKTYIVSVSRSFRQK